VAHYKLGSGVKVVDVDELGDPNVLSDAPHSRWSHGRKLPPPGARKAILWISLVKTLGSLNRHVGPMGRLRGMLEHATVQSISGLN